MKTRKKFGVILFVMALPVALAGSYLRDAFSVWEESGAVFYVFASLYVFASFALSADPFGGDR